MVLEFIEKNLENDSKSFETLNDIYERYLLFCETKYVKPLTKQKLNIQLRKHNQGIKDYRFVDGTNEIIRYGVRLK